MNGEWKLVPVEPTQEMRVAAEHEIDRAAIHNYGGAPSYEDIWNWMLAAAPTPSVQEDEPVGDLTVSDINGRKDAHFDYYDTLEDGQYLLYTHPADDKLRKAAEEVAGCFDDDVVMNVPALIRKIRNLRAELHKGKS